MVLRLRTDLTRGGLSMSNSKNKEANLEYLDRLQKRLLKNKKALASLYSQGLSSETKDLFRLGLSEPYLDKENILHADALLAPVKSEHGIFIGRNVYLNLPEVTINPLEEVSWMRGTALTYFAEKSSHHTLIVVCDNLFDLWLLEQAIRASGKNHLKLLPVCATPAGTGKPPFPEEWIQTRFWRKFEVVYLAHSNTALGDKTAVAISQIAGCETRRLRPAADFGMTWAEFWRKGGILDEFHRHIAEAPVLGINISADSTDSTALGRFDYNPVDIGRTFYRGHLYYVTKTGVNSLESIKKYGKGLDWAETEKTPVYGVRRTSRKETVVVRSDRTLLTHIEEPYPRGTPPEDRILRLTDGTLIDSPPVASEFTTWPWAAINDYLEGQNRKRPLKEILNDVKDFLNASVWLPFEQDYDLLTLLVPVTFAQPVFDAVPLVLVTGPAASGKTELGIAMCQICANASIVGQISPAAAIRQNNYARGFLFIDDLEGISRNSSKSRDTPLFSEFVQLLKVSYKKDTSYKRVINISRGMKVENLDFFGVKMITNTSGVDAILGSRMLVVQSGKIPPELKIELEIQKNKLDLDLEHLRHELHCFTFENAALIYETYKRLFPRPLDRFSEIVAPLRVFAELSESFELSNGLDSALKAQLNRSAQSANPVNPVKIMIQAAKEMILQGYRQVSPTHVLLEMRAILHRSGLSYEFLVDDHGKPVTAQWIGRFLRTYEIVDINTPASRYSFYGQSLRVYPINSRFISKTLNEFGLQSPASGKKAQEFCSVCQNCNYQSLGCPLMTNRMNFEKKQAR